MDVFSVFPLKEAEKKLLCPATKRDGGGLKAGPLRKELDGGPGR